METIKSFFSYLFNTNPGPQFSYYIAFIIFCSLLALTIIVFSQIYKKKKKSDFAFKRLFKRVNTFALVFLLVFLFLIAVRYENIPYFSMRIWLYTAIILFFYTIYHYVKIYKKVYPHELQNIPQQKPKQEKNRYTAKKRK